MTDFPALPVQRPLWLMTLADLARMAGSIDKLRPFVEADDWTPGGLTDDARLRGKLTPAPKQLELF